MRPALVSAPASWTLDATFSWANSAIVQSSTRESLIVDAETRELRLSLARGFEHGLALRLHLPLRETTAGSLDGFIDDWHSTFGLPEGARPTLTEDSLRLFYRRDGRVAFASTASARGIGDIAIDVGKQLGASERGAFAGWLSLKLPTGDANEFAGSGSVDVAASMSGQQRFGERWEVFGQLSGTWLGNGDRLSTLQRDLVWAATAGISVDVFGALQLTVQLDAHTGVFDSDTDFLGDAVLLSLGGTYAFESDWQLSAAVTEDIDVETSPDVVFVLALRKTF